MEGTESEELKSVIFSPGTSECLRVKRKSFSKKKNKKRPSSRNSGTMEGTESEELKSVTRGSDASQESSECLRGVKCKRVNKKKERVSRMEEGADASQGTSECLRVKRKSFSKKKKKKHPSSRNSGTMEGNESEELKSVKRGSDASQESSECLRGVKCKKVKKKKKKQRATSVQRTTGIKSNRIDKELASRLEGCIDVALRRKKRASSLSDVLEPMRLEHAEMALEFYGKSHKDAEFEVVEVVDISSSIMRHPEFDRGHLCCHASFIAKPKKDDCNVFPKHFLAEFFKDHYGKFQFTYCDIFEPSDVPGFYHGCLICSPAQRFHPSDGYSLGRPPWYKAARVFR